MGDLSEGMNNMEGLYERAVKIAARAHGGQVDKGGNPYITHPLAVAEKVEGTKLKIVAVLHDVLEDSDMTAEDLLKEGFDRELVEAIQALTHDRDGDVSYEEYIRHVKKNPMARVVKIADLHHNLDLSRIPQPTDCDYQRCVRYRNALAYLTEL